MKSRGFPPASKKNAILRGSRRENRWKVKARIFLWWLIPDQGYAGKLNYSAQNQRVCADHTTPTEQATHMGENAIKRGSRRGAQWNYYIFKYMFLTDTSKYKVVPKIVVTTWIHTSKKVQEHYHKLHILLNETRCQKTSWKCHRLLNGM